MSSFVITKLDTIKAFDRLKVSCVISFLETTGAPLWLIYAYVDTLWSNRLEAIFDGKKIEEVRCYRGLRQGRVDSMTIFTRVLSFALQPLLQQWKRQNLGVAFAS
eukprot:9955949-Karenia_brevis.AAC.1